MNDPMATPPPLSDRSGVTDAVRAQILATEHWSLLATRSMSWNEVFSRASMFFTVLSAAMVALALVAQITAFGAVFRMFALLLLPIVLLVGLSTLIRLSDANAQDARMVMGMNRLRHAYLELAPELERYFVTGQHDDSAGYMQTLGLQSSGNGGPRVSHFLAGTPNVVAAINAVLVGVLAALIADVVGATETVQVVVGIAGALTTAVGFVLMAILSIASARRAYRPRFPSNGAQG